MTSSPPTPFYRRPSLLVLLALLLLAVGQTVYRSLTRGEDLVAWRHGPAALSPVAAEDRARPRLVNFTADWCPPCREMKGRVYARPEVAEAMSDGFLPIRIDMTRPGEDENYLSRALQVHALPTLLLLGADGREQARLEGYLPAEDLLAWLTEHRPTDTHVSWRTDDSAAN